MQTFASGFANLRALATIVSKHENTNSSDSLSPKQLKFSCSLRIDRSLYDNKERQNARSRHCLSNLKPQKVEHYSDKQEQTDTIIQTIYSLMPTVAIWVQL